MKTSFDLRGRFIFIVMLFAALVLFFLSACNSQKELFETKQTDNKTEKSDSGSTGKKSSKEEGDFDYFKKTWYQPPVVVQGPAGKDGKDGKTIIVQVPAYTEENGKGTYKNESSQSDSNWSKVDEKQSSTAQQKDLHKETETFTLKHIIGISLGVSLLVVIVGKFLGGFSIIRKPLP